MSNFKKRIKNKIRKPLRELQLLAKNYKIGLKKGHNSTIIAVFDGKVSHGGLVDRLKGIISLYEYSQLNNLDFRIYFKSPFNLEDYFQENSVRWNINTLDRIFPSSKPIFLINEFNLSRLIKPLSKNGEKEFHIYCNIDYLKQLYPTYTQEQINRHWGTRFNELFKMSSNLESGVNNILSNLTHHKTGIHFRFGSILNDFNDTFQRNLTPSEKRSIVDKSMEQIERILDRHTNDSHFLFSDSYSFLTEAKETFPQLKIIEGIPVHTDLNGAAEESGHYKTLLDFMILSKMNRIYFVKSKEMHSSNFSKYAAMIGDSIFRQIDI